MIGGAALLADGVITPSITVTSSIEGLRLFNPDIPVIPIVLLIIGVIFFIQQFGTNFIGSSFGPIMLIWFTTLGVLGFSQLILHPGILVAVNPEYAFRFLTEYPGGFILLGCSFSLYNRGRSLICRPGALRKKKYQGFLDICQNSSSSELFRTGSMADDESRIGTGC